MECKDSQGAIEAIEKLELTMGDVLMVKGNGAEASGVALEIAKTGILPKGTPIIILNPGVDVTALRNAPKDVKKAIFDAMDFVPEPIVDWK